MDLQAFTAFGIFIASFVGIAIASFVVTIIFDEDERWGMAWITAVLIAAGILTSSIMSSLPA